jgi:hypothetical protein
MTYNLVADVRDAYAAVLPEHPCSSYLLHRAALCPAWQAARILVRRAEILILWSVAA